jgi:DNA-binding CsgD family transcriptional regulator
VLDVQKDHEATVRPLWSPGHPQDLGRLSAVTRVRSSEVERLADAATDSRTLRVQLVDLLSRQMSVDWSVFMLTDPRTAVGVDPVANVPEDIPLPALIKSRYLSQHPRWTAQTGAVALGDDPASSLVWREWQSSYGVRDVLCAVFRDAYGTWGFLDLWSRGRYDDQDRRLLETVGPMVTSALRRLQGASLRPRTPMEVGEPVVLLLDDSLRVVGSTDAAHEWLARLLPPRPGAMPVPAVAWNVAAQLLAKEAGVDDHDPFGRVHLGGGVWIAVRAARIGSGGDIAVSLDQVSAVDRLDLVARAHGLTGRETSVLAQVCAGRSNADVGAALHLSPLTVQDHLKSIFARTSVSSRGELAALTMGVGTTAGRGEF